MNFKSITIFVLLICVAYQVKVEYGVDVSNWQGAVNWSEVHSAGKTFAFLKATESTTYTDREYARNKANAKAVGIKTGAYHFFHPNVDGVAQAQHFIKVGGCHDHQLPPVLDVEVTKGMSSSVIARRSLDWLRYIKKECGIKPAVYTSYSFITSHLQDSEFAEYPLWIAYWSKHARVPHPWRYWSFWQYTDKESVKGIGNCDADAWDTSIWPGSY